MDDKNDKKVSEPTVVTAPREPLMRRISRGFWKLACLILLLALVVSVALWRPWEATPKASDRTVSVSGTATITAEPDEYVFNPSYEFVNTDKKAALAEMTKKSDEVVAKLKSLGVPNNKIKSSSSGYNDKYLPTPDGENTYNLSLTVNTTKALVQKVQDYLVTTSPTGSVSPQATFSKEKTKSLEAQARDKAEADARARAEQSAKNLGFKVGGVKTVNDNGFNDFGGCRGDICASTMELRTGATLDAAAPSLSVQPGENDFNYTVTVVYYIK
jgi:uncharacterized protein